MAKQDSAHLKGGKAEKPSPGPRGKSPKRSLCCKGSPARPLSQDQRLQTPDQRCPLVNMGKVRSLFRSPKACSSSLNTGFLLVQPLPPDSRREKHLAKFHLMPAGPSLEGPNLGLGLGEK